MKKLFVTALAIFLGVCVAFADEVDEGLSSMASEQVRSCIRQMIQLGVDSDQALKMTVNMLKNKFREEQILRAQQMIINAMVYFASMPVPTIAPSTAQSSTCPLSNTRYIHKSAKAQKNMKGPSMVIMIPNAAKIGIAW